MHISYFETLLSRERASSSSSSSSCAAVRLALSRLSHRRCRRHRLFPTRKRSFRRRNNRGTSLHERILRSRRNKADEKKKKKRATGMEAGDFENCEERISFQRTRALFESRKSINNTAEAGVNFRRDIYLNARERFMDSGEADRTLYIDRRFLVRLWYKAI